jgi:hypothetical protein
MTFSYILAGWEGSAHDGKVYQDALGKGLAVFAGKYYLADAGYALSKYLLTPYRGVRYHLKEWKVCNLRPQTKEELFNHRHASLRNIIERAFFGILKKRFPIFELMHSYSSLHLQINLVLCGVMIHNYIRRNQGDEDEYDNVDDYINNIRMTNTS